MDKMNKDKESAFQISKIIGMGSNDQFSITCSKKSGKIAYICGPYAILYDCIKNCQTNYIQNKNNKAFSCLDISQSGNILACGEGRFKNPEIILYDISSEGKIKHNIMLINLFK